LTGIKQNCVEGKFENPEERFRGNGHAMHAEAMSHLLPATPPPVNMRGRRREIYPYTPTNIPLPFVAAYWYVPNGNWKTFLI